MSIKDKLIKVGKFTGTHGIKGELKLFIFNEFELNQSLVDKNIFLMDSKMGLSTFIVEKDYFKSGKQIIKLKEFDNINQILNLSKSEIYLNINDGLFDQVEDLIGYEVVDSGEIIGIVVDEMASTMQELFKVKTETNKEFWIPNVDRYVQEIDKENKKIYVIDSKGLM